MCTVYKIMRDKVKKKSLVSWKYVLDALSDPEKNCEFMQLKFNYFAYGSWRKRRKPMSDNRTAYNVLKRYYSTTSLRYLKMKCTFEFEHYGSIYDEL